jgi:hypothetical protein
MIMMKKRKGFNKTRLLGKNEENGNLTTLRTEPQNASRESVTEPNFHVCCGNGEVYND